MNMKINISNISTNPLGLKINSCHKILSKVITYIIITNLQDPHQISQNNIFHKIHQIITTHPTSLEHYMAITKVVMPISKVICMQMEMFSCVGETLSLHRNCMMGEMTEFHIRKPGSILLPWLVTSHYYER